MRKYTIVTSGSSYLDIDAFACCIALSELKTLLGFNAIAYSSASINYSVTSSLLVYKDRMFTQLPSDCDIAQSNFIIVDLSDPNYIEDVVLLDRVVEIFDHHTGFEDFWHEKLGKNSNIHFIGAAATLVYFEWSKHNMLSKMPECTAKLLLAGVLDNTLNLFSSNTTELDVQAKKDLCKIAGVGDDWCQDYFKAVQSEIEGDLKTSILKDIKHIRTNNVLPSTIGQLAVWDTKRIIERLNEIRAWFDEISPSWLINIIDISCGCSYFICNDALFRARIGNLFDVHFVNDIVKIPNMFLRKEILKKAKYLK